ncbi:MAG: YggT family protein [Armatimonadota bacterium]
MLSNQIIIVIRLLARAYYVLLLVRIIFSWLNIRRPHPILMQLQRIAYAATEPLLRPIRNALAKYQRGVPIDFSPLVAWLLIEVVLQVLTSALR